MKKDQKDGKKPSSPAKPAKGRGKQEELSSEDLDKVSGGLLAYPIYDGDPDGPLIP